MGLSKAVKPIVVFPVAKDVTRSWPLHLLELINMASVGVKPVPALAFFF